MIHLVVYAAHKEEGRRLLSAIRARAAKESSQELECELFQQAEKAAGCLKRGGVTAIGWDMSGAHDRAVFTEVRECCREAYLLVLAGPETSPLTFLTPAVAPSSLIIRPLSDAELERAAREMFVSIRRAYQARQDKGCFTIAMREEQRRIPYSDIYYFEARGRKLYARLRDEEIGFSGTLDGLEDKLPQTFQRCHRSFIVNKNQIERVLLAQGMLSLWDGLAVPVSRSYKKAIKTVKE